MTNLGNKDIFTKNLKMYMEQFGKNQKKMAALVQKINCTKKTERTPTFRQEPFL